MQNETNASENSPATNPAQWINDDKLARQLLTSCQVRPNEFCKVLLGKPQLFDRVINGLKNNRYSGKKYADATFPDGTIPVFMNEHAVYLAVLKELPNNTLEEMGDSLNCMVKTLLMEPDEFIRVAAALTDSEENLTSDGISAIVQVEAAVALLEKIDTLPPLPDHFVRLLSMIKDERVEVAELVTLIESDTALTAELLRVINSASLGVKSHVDNVTQAITLLGLNVCEEIAICLAVNIYITKISSSSLLQYNEAATTCAHFAGLLSKALELENETSLFSAALLHDIGRPVMEILLGNEYRKLTKGLHGEALVNRERLEYGIAHTEVGYTFASNIGLPDNIKQSIRYHHNPELIQNNQQVKIVHLAQLISHNTEELTSQVRCSLQGLGVL